MPSPLTQATCGKQIRWRVSLGLFCSLLFLATPARPAPSFVQSGSILTMSNVNVTIQYDLTSGNAAFYWQNLRIISAFYSGVTLSTGYLKGTSYSSWSYSVVSSNEVAVTATGNGNPTMKQFFTLDQSNSFLVRVEMDGVNLSANWMGPVVVHATDGVDIGSYGDVRALFVPFDNDGFVTYNAMSINSSDTGYEVGAFYDNVSRNGLVVGSVTHDTWKSGVFWLGSSNVLTELNVFGGAVSSTYTHDVDAHGSVVGNSISSPTVFVGYGLDWRQTMQDFAAENTNMAPKLTWTNGVPFGWNSWGVIQTAISYSDATNASGFIYTNLQNTNFNDNGVAYINLDSYWSVNLTSSQVLSFVNYCHANGQKCGLYLTPFAWFGAASNAATTTVQGSSYTYSQVLLQTTNGSYEADGTGLAMDPTHPGTQQRIAYLVNEMTNWGVDYIKIDFLTHGSLEGVHYNTNTTTGIQAYNAGMQYLYNQINGRMFISESIAPLFPYQYGHARRIACDAEASKISNTAYTLNSVTYGWWLDRLYCFNDPDLMVFDGPTTNENQSRLISCAITGLFLDGDSFTNATSQSDAIKCLTNAAINAVARVGQSFTPVEGNTGTNAATFFVRQDGTTWCVAVFNYGSSAVTTNVSLSRAGISGNYVPKDLWSGATSTITNSTLTVQLNAKQAKLFRLFTPPVLANPVATSDRVFSCTLQADAGYDYVVQTSTDLMHWTTVTTLTNLTGQVQFTQTNTPGIETCFYRAELVQ